MDLKFKEQANSSDRNNNEMRVLVYKNDEDDFICPHCGEKIKLNTEKIDEIISSNNNIKDTIEGIKFSIDNVIKVSTSNVVNIQLKNITALLNNINEDIKKINEKLKNLLNENEDKTNVIINEFPNKNVIKGVLDVKLNELDNKITLFNTVIKNGIDVYLNNKKINMIQEGDLWKIDYNFEKDGKYIFQIVFNDIINNMNGFFEYCSNIISLDFSNFSNENVIDMRMMFSNCNKLKEIKGINNFATINVKDMAGMFQK